MATDLPYGGKVSLDDLLQCRTLPRDVGRRLQESAGSEGQVTVDAVVGLLVDERRAANDRKLTRSIIMQLLVALVVLLAAFAGSIYMVVKLDSVVGNDNGIMVSRSTGQPVAVGSLVKQTDGLLLYQMLSLNELLALEQLMVGTNTSDGDTTVTVYNVASAQVLPGETAVVTTTSGEEFEINANGMFLVNTTSAAAARGRRRLMQTPEEEALAQQSVLEAQAQASAAGAAAAEQQAADQATLAGPEAIAGGVVAIGAVAAGAAVGGAGAGAAAGATVVEGAEVSGIWEASVSFAEILAGFV
ncbi:hypothetical protein PSENEW3_00000495 [Picochlorum sp. SENEW3]|nr:hypothetical protein PSENEW3_00000495 [Picochlorum sp. SENEW3]